MIAELIKEAARNCIAEQVKAELLFGTVEGLSPPAVSVENRLLLEGDRLILARELEKRSVSLQFDGETREIELHPGLQGGDIGVLIRLGGYFYVAGRLSAGEGEAYGATAAGNTGL